MKKSNKYYLILLGLFFSTLFFLQHSFAKDDINFLSLKKDEVICGKAHPLNIRLN